MLGVEDHRLPLKMLNIAALNLMDYLLKVEADAKIVVCSEGIIIPAKILCDQ